MRIKHSKPIRATRDCGIINDVISNKKGEIFSGKFILGGREALSLLKQKGIQHIALGFGHCSALKLPIYDSLELTDVETICEVIIALQNGNVGPSHALIY